jgi:hypothetical protein
MSFLFADLCCLPWALPMCGSTGSPTAVEALVLSGANVRQYLNPANVKALTLVHQKLICINPQYGFL